MLSCLSPVCEPLGYIAPERPNLGACRKLLADARRNLLGVARRDNQNTSRRVRRCCVRRDNRDVRSGGNVSLLKGRGVDDVEDFISWREIANTYFQRGSSWFYHKLNGHDGNGKPDGFTPEEAETLRNALIDIANRLRRAADRI